MRDYLELLAGIGRIAKTILEMAKKKNPEHLDNISWFQNCCEAVVNKTGEKGMRTQISGTELTARKTGRLMCFKVAKTIQLRQSPTVLA